MAKTLSNLMLAVSCAVALLLSGCGGGKDDAAPQQEEKPDTQDLLMALSNRMKTAKDIGNQVVKAEEYLTIARELQALQNFKDSTAAIKNAVGTTGWFSNPADQGRVQAEIAVLYLRAKKPDEAKKQFDKAVELLEQLKDDPAGQAIIQAHLANAEFEQGKKDEAKTRLKTAEETAKLAAPTEKERRVLALLAVAQAAKRMGDGATVSSATGNLANWLAEVPAPMQAEMSIAAAALLNGSGDEKEAETHLQAGIDAAEKIEDKAVQAKLLLEAASVRNAWKQPAKAEPLLDQVDKLLPSIKDKGQLETAKAKVKIERFHVERHTPKKAEKK